MIAVARKLRVLFFDVESAPLLAHVWGQREDFIPINRLIHDSFLLSWAAKEEDRKTIRSQVLTPDEARAQDDSRIVQSLADLIRKSDFVVAHNADRFDIPVLNTRLLGLGQEPIGPVKTIDTLKLARKSFRLASNKLDYLARFLGVPAKLDTDFELWKSCYQGDEKALRYMVRYNRGDVRTLEGVYQALKPYVKGLPRLVEADSAGEEACPFCGEDALQRRGYTRTSMSTFRRFQCQGCLRWSRARSSEPAKTSTVPV